MKKEIDNLNQEKERLQTLNNISKKTVQSLKDMRIIFVRSDHGEKFENESFKKFFFKTFFDENEFRMKKT